MSTIQSLTLNVYKYIKKYDLIPYGSTLIIGLSGGPDSVFLTHFLVQLSSEYNVRLIAAHLNHGWRVDAEEDAEFCRVLAQDLGIAYVQDHMDNFKDAIKINGSAEEVGRCARRLFFERCMRKNNAHYTVLGHHADDQQETFFIRMMRGATLSGLCGMRPRSGNYIRPLLYIYKKDILAYMEEHALAYRIDSTNEDVRYLRNSIRHTILPSLKSADKRFDENFARMIMSFQETERFLDRYSQQAFQQVMIVDINHGAGVCIKTLLMYDIVVRDRIIMHWLHNHHVAYVPQERFIQEIVRFLSNPRGGTHRLHEQWYILKKHANAYIQVIT